MRKKMAFIIVIIIMNYSLCHVSAETVSGGDLIGGSNTVMSEVNSAEMTEPVDTEKMQEVVLPVNSEMLPETEEVAGPVYNVTFPAKTVACLDPDNLSGRGQIFSDEYVVENYSNTDVSIRVKNVKVFYFSTESVYEFYETGIEENSSDVKRLDVNLVWVNNSENTERVLHVTEGECDETVLVLKAAEYNNRGEFISLNEGSTGFFYFTGTLNANPNIVWEDGEVELQFDYEIVNAKSEIPEGTPASEEAETDSGQADNLVQPMEEDNASSSEINSGQDGQSEETTETEKAQGDDGSIKTKVPEGTSVSEEDKTDSSQTERQDVQSAEDDEIIAEEDNVSSSEIDSGQDMQSNYITESEKEQDDAKKILDGAGESMTESERKGEDPGSENMAE